MYDSEAPTSTSVSTQRRLNWPLLIGGALLFLILFLAVFGPSLAPKDPREHALIIQIDGQWKKPPYPAFTPGYPLGSDNLGRDLFSWLLWSIRPTMVLVIIVAMLRMTFGLSIGAAAGWSDRWPARMFDSLISAALAAPALIAALIVITAIGFRFGVWAFVVGLAVTGWAETAQLVREQTRTIKSQEAVEAARALGASGVQIFILHIVPQVMPMIWMLLAFEIANTLVTTAGLGFLGYYLGGAVFTEVDDFVYQRISEMPELGQMLSTVWMVLDEPWAMVAAGTVVFVIVLAFNLLGEGLQARLTRKVGGARRIYLFLAGGVAPWADERVILPMERLARSSWGKRAAVLALVIVVAGAGLRVLTRQSLIADMREPSAAVATPPLPGVGQDSEASESESMPVSAFKIPGDHIWANEWADPWATQWITFTGPTTTTVQWTYQIEGGFTGGPVVDAQGVLYVAARPAAEAPGKLYAFDSEGTLLWEVRLDDRPTGAPALGPDGTVYVADKSGLSAVSTAGRVLWRFTPDDGKPATTGPIVGPDGTIYYKLQSGLVSLTADGALRWHAPIEESLRALAPKLSPDGETVFWGEYAFREAGGEPIPRDEQAVAPTQFVAGANGKSYVQYDVQLVEPAPSDQSTPEAETIAGAARVFDWRDHTWQGTGAGVTPSGQPWLLARPAIGGMGLGFFWGTPDGDLSSKLSIPGANSIKVVGVDRESVAYICMDFYSAASSCVAFGPDSDRTLWRAEFRGTQALAGAALAPGRLFVTTWDGKVMALGAAEVEIRGGGEP